MSVENEMHIIDVIQKLREKNNEHWMDLVKLALRVAPTEAKVILADIRRMDGHISDMMACIIPPRE